MENGIRTEHPPDNADALIVDGDHKVFPFAATAIVEATAGRGAGIAPARRSTDTPAQLKRSGKLKRIG